MPIALANKIQTQTQLIKKDTAGFSATTKSCARVEMMAMRMMMELKTQLKRRHRKYDFFFFFFFNA